MSAISPESVPLDRPDDPARERQRPPAPRRLLPFIGLNSVVLFATYVGLISVLLPVQIAGIDARDKVTNLAIVTTTSFVFTLFAQPIVGAFSDRTRSRMGRRAPWMVIGAAVAAIFMVGLGSLTSIVWITIFWVIIQVALNALQGPLTAIIPDRFPRSRRGVASAMVGLGTMLGIIAGAVLAGQLAASYGIGYTIFGSAVLVVTLIFVIANRDFSSKDLRVPSWSWTSFISGFWISPRTHPDFAWAFSARFLFILGYFVINTFQLYILTDFIGVPLARAGATVGLLAAVGGVTTIIAVLVSGWWSDRIKRRKVFLYVATVFMAIGLAVPLLMPTLTGMIILNLIVGLGFGIYQSCDTALMTEVLPGDGAAAGKDLGILNVATNIPQALSPAIAGLIIGSLGGYPMLFVFGIIAVCAASLVLIPIKSIR